MEGLTAVPVLHAVCHGRAEFNSRRCSQIAAHNQLLAARPHSPTVRGLSCLRLAQGNACSSFVVHGGPAVEAPYHRMSFFQWTFQGRSNTILLVMCIAASALTCTLVSTLAVTASCHSDRIAARTKRCLGRIHPDPAGSRPGHSAPACCCSEQLESLPLQGSMTKGRQRSRKAPEPCLLGMHTSRLWAMTSQIRKVVFQQVHLMRAKAWMAGENQTQAGRLLA